MTTATEDTSVRRNNAQLAARKDSTSIGHLLVEDGAISAQQLKRALTRQQFTPRTPLGQILIEAGYVTASQLETFLAKQRAVRTPCTDSISEFAHSVAELTQNLKIAR